MRLGRSQGGAWWWMMKPTPKWNLWRNKKPSRQQCHQPNSSWDHLTHLTFSPQWSINVRVWAKVTTGLYPAALTKPSISCPNLFFVFSEKIHRVVCISITKVPRCILYYRFKLHSKCSIPSSHFVLHACVPGLTLFYPPTHAFKCSSQSSFTASEWKKHLVSWQRKWEHFIKWTKWTSEVM